MITFGKEHLWSLEKIQMSVEGEKKVESRERAAHLSNPTSNPLPASHLPPQVRIATGTRQTQPSCFCDLFICCNQSLLLPRLPNSCRDKEMGLRFQRLDDLC